MRAVCVILCSMQKHASTIRKVNAVLAAVLTVFFFAHALLGSVTQAFHPVDAPVVLIWTLMGVGVVHIVASVFTTYVMFTDEVRPPSSRKKRHQWLKWTTGALLAVVAIWHALRPDTSADALLIVVLAVLAWHAFIGSKSIVRDLDMPRFMKAALRVAVVAVSVLIAVFVLVALR